MTYRYVILCLFGAFSIINGSLTWSNTYSFKAVLSMPSANITEPYQVWVDGETEKSRIDFYDGMDKIFKFKTDEGYRYYKIHPETTDNFYNEEVCEQLNPNSSLTCVYEYNMYLPEKDFKYVANETLNGVLTEKWVYDTKTIAQSYRAEFIYTMWIVHRKSSSDNQMWPVPVRYEFRIIVDGVYEDYFKHDYSHYDDKKPDAEIFFIGNEYDCPIRSITEHEPIDPLTEYIDPVMHDDRLHKAFISFKEKHNKTYIDEKEQRDRFLIFKNNLRFINSMNRQHRTFSLSVNHLVDRTDSELAALFGINNFDELTEHDHNIDKDEEQDDDHSDVFDKFNWKDYNAISPVKDQTILCGSCYAFTVAATVESSSYVARGCKNLIELSEQALVDCTYNTEYRMKGFGNRGCKGGSFVYTLYWIRNHGIPYRSEYGPYLAMEGECHNTKMSNLSKINNFVRLKKNKNVIKKSIQKYGPLVVGVNSKPKTFVFYSKGVYNDVSCRAYLSDLTHAMSLIGYGREGDQEYWILKNSYGPKWGENGYIKIAINSNICGTMNLAYRVEYKENKVEECFKRHVQNMNQMNI